MLTDLFPPFIGGLEQHVRNLSHALVARGHEVSVATMSHGDLPLHEVDRGVQVHRLRGTAQRASRFMNPSGRPYLPPIPDPELVLALDRLLRREEPSIVHAHNWMSHSFLPLKNRGRAKLVATLHDYGVVCAKRSLMYRGDVCSGPALMKCLRCAAGHYGTAKGMLIALGNRSMRGIERSTVDMYLPVSQAVAVGNDLHEHATPYRVLPNFVPDDVALRADPAHPSLATLPSDPYLLFVGALSRAKGVDVLLDAYGRLHGAPPLVLIGTRWPDTPGGIPPNVTIIESVPHEAVMGAWRRSIAAIVPSVFPDPCPTVVMEAMASGVPVIGSRTGGIPDLVIDGQTGILVEAGNAAELSDAIRRVVTDPTSARRMGEAGLRHVEHFTATTVVDRLERIYLELTAAPPTPATIVARSGETKTKSLT